MEVNGEFRTSIITTPNGHARRRKTDAPAGGAIRDAYDSYEVRGWATAASWASGATPARRCCPTATTTTTIRSCRRPDAVVINVELIHDNRIVRLNGKHRTDGVRPWMGDSIGWYEGDTLVVETTNIPQASSCRARGRT
jgi:hypothetical protein